MNPLQRRKSGRWTDQEKQLLQSLVQRYGCNWRLIAIHMPRDQRQIREHIQELYRQHGRQWKLIASFFPGFSPIMVRNHWNNLQRKRNQQQPDFPSQVDHPQFGNNQQQLTTLTPPSDNIRKKMSITYLLN
ncbi:5256_t:CDS:2 [Gigaspora margarita]|uniref:5256_t:CDS:1 n=1 Tax=Gigaspora margarita TaxID=4874 RepID=A0ABN7VFX3_GIGMA|nr:5256_t:CDS:2 [Gigaspora margarita]